MRCPACGNSNDAAEVCAACGVVIAKAIERAELQRRVEPLLRLVGERADAVASKEVHLAPGIPSRLLAAARRELPGCRPEETPLVLIASSTLGLAHWCLLTHRALHLNPSGGSPHSRTLDEIRSFSVTKGLVRKVKADDLVLYIPTDPAWNADELVLLGNRILAESHQERGGPVVVDVTGESCPSSAEETETSASSALGPSSSSLAAGSTRDARIHSVIEAHRPGLDQVRFIWHPESEARRLLPHLAAHEAPLLLIRAKGPQPDTLTLITAEAAHGKVGDLHWTTPLAQVTTIDVRRGEIVADNGRIALITGLDRHGQRLVEFVRDLIRAAHGRDVSRVEAAVRTLRPRPTQEARGPWWLGLAAGAFMALAGIGGCVEQLSREDPFASRLEFYDVVDRHGARVGGGTSLNAPVIFMGALVLGGGLLILISLPRS